MSCCKIKPLEWTEHGKSWRTRTAFGPYEILFSCGAWFISVSPTNTADDAEFKTADEAKNMCQEHWNTMIGSALHDYHV